MTGRLPAGSIFEMPGNRRAEREFAERVDSAFEPDQEAIARVRAAILAQVPQPVPVAAATDRALVRRDPGAGER